MYRLIHKDYTWFPTIEETIVGSYGTEAEAVAALAQLKSDMAANRPGFQLLTILDGKGFSYGIPSMGGQPNTYSWVAL